MIAVLRSGRASRWSCPTPEQTKYGAVETRDEARACADLFRAHRDEIDGIIVTLPNFGEERGDRGRAADGRTCDVPVLMQATPDTAGAHDDLATGATASAARCRPATT